MILNRIWHVLQKLVKFYFVPLPRLSYIYSDLLTLRTRISRWIGFLMCFMPQKGDVFFFSTPTAYEESELTAIDARNKQCHLIDFFILSKNRMLIQKERLISRFEHEILKNYWFFNSG